MSALWAALVGIGLAAVYLVALEGIAALRLRRRTLHRKDH